MANENSTRTKSLILGWDGADWQLIDSLIAQGKMPYLKALVQKASRGQWATLQPVLSPLLWTSIATGQRPHRHGILSFAQYQEGRGVEPVSSEKRRCKAFWNILEEAGHTCSVVNWWPSFPVEQVSGAMVSARYFDWDAGPEEGSAREGQVYPAALSDSLRSFCLHPGQLSPAHLRPFFPMHERAQLESDPMVAALASILARATSVLQVSLDLLARGQSDCFALYFEAIDQVSHLAMRYHPPRLAEIDPAEFARYQHMVSATYQWHDLALGRLLQALDPHTHVFLLSDHGFESGALRSAQLPDLPAAPALEHRPYGVFLAAGPEFQSGQEILGASLLDFLPSLLHVYRLPIGEDLPGRVLVEAFRQMRPFSHIPSWELSPRVADLVPARASASKESLQKLEELGYLDLPALKQREYLAWEEAFNKLISLLDGGELQSAWDYWQSLGSAPEDLRWGNLQADLLLRMQRYSDFDALWASWPAAWQEHAYGRFLRALSLLERGQHQGALALFEALEGEGLSSAQLFCESGRAWQLADQPEAALAAFDRALQVNPTHSAALTGAAAALIDLQRAEEALPLLEHSIQLRLWQPQAHYYLAQIWAKQEQRAEALQALALCLKQAPRHAKALALQAQLKGKSSPQNAATVIVSGLPRSGTSLLMRLLAAGGLPLLYDDERSPDVHSPHGYFELSAVKQLTAGAKLPPSAGKGLKVVSALLPYLPADRQYYVIWLERPLLEVILSQQKMLGKKSAQDFPFAAALQMEAEEERRRAWIKSQPHMRCLFLSFHQFFEAPESALRKLAQFLPFAWDEVAAQAVIDPSLYRSKIG